MSRGIRPTRIAAAFVALGLLVGSFAVPATTVAAEPADIPALPEAPLDDGVAATTQLVVRWSAESLGGGTRAQRRAKLDDAGRVAAIGRAAGHPAAFVRPFGLAGTTGIYRLDRPLGKGAPGIVRRIEAMPGVLSA